jgi:hypothetical protein
MGVQRDGAIRYPHVTEIAADSPKDLLELIEDKG